MNRRRHCRASHPTCLRRGGRRVEGSTGSGSHSAFGRDPGLRCLDMTSGLLRHPLSRFADTQPHISLVPLEPGNTTPKAPSTAPLSLIALTPLSGVPPLPAMSQSPEGGGALRTLASPLPSLWSSHFSTGGGKNRGWGQTDSPGPRPSFCRVGTFAVKAAPL